MTAKAKRRVIWAVAIAVTLAILFCGWNWICGNRPYRFYGRLVTPEGEGIAGACVVFAEECSNSPWIQIGGRTVVLLPGLIDVNRSEAITDQNGDFELAGWRTCELRLMGVTKDEKVYWFVLPSGVVPKMGFILSRSEDRKSMPETPAKRLVYPMAPVDK